jgi:hypothetical protein
MLVKLKESLSTRTTVDVSTKPLNDLIKEQGERKYGQRIFHIIIPDFCKTVLHSSHVIDAVIGTLLGLMDEGIDRNMFYGQQYSLNFKVRMGLITGITPPLFKRYFRKWNTSGLLTRPFIISYHYSDDTIKEIQSYIRDDLPFAINETVARIRKKGKKDISINSDISAAIQLLNEEIVKRLKTFYVSCNVGKTSYKIYLEIQGFRMHKMLRLLAKSIAYDHDRDAVNYEDLAELKDLADLIRLPDNPKEI